MELIFWQPMLSIHQSALVRGLSNQGCAITVIAETGVPAERKVMGWGTPDFGDARVIVAPSPEQAALLIDTSAPECIHLVGGGNSYPLGRWAIRRLAKNGQRFGLMTEPADGQGWKGLLRWVKYTGEWIRVGRHYDFILAMGQMGVEWFRRCGYSKERLFPFAYTTEMPSIQCSSPSTSPKIELVLLGQCIPRKGGDLLIRSLAKVSLNTWHLSVVGDGPSAHAWRALASQQKIENNIYFAGMMSNAEAVAQLAQADLCILPSRFDGWGAVVNEALMCGVPVLCSDHCGAQDLLQQPWLGEVYPARSTTALAAVLNRWIGRGKRTAKSTDIRRRWASSITGYSAATYVLDILHHVYEAKQRPQPPWYKDVKDPCIKQGANVC